MADVPDFSGVSEQYAASRPSYPAQLFDWLASCVERRDLAWDAATGSGQAAIGLASRFARVVATDVSASQLSHAKPHPRIEYRVGSAEDSGLPASSVDVAVAAAAIHWFDLDRFYAEVGRVIRPGGVLAAWSYHVAHVSPPLGEILRPFYEGLVGPYFAAGARMVDARYTGLKLPGDELTPPPLSVSVRWSAEDVLRFIRTWSGVHAYVAAKNEDPVDRIATAIRDAFGDRAFDLSFPLYIRAARQR